MTHSALADAVLFWLVGFMTLLLVMFLFAVIATPPEDAVRAEAPVLKPPAPAAPPPALPVRQPQAPTSPAATVGQPTGAGHAARHASAAATVISPPKVPGGPPSWRTPVLLIAGLTMAVIGGWLFLRTPPGAMPCSHQAAAVCSQAFVVLPATQLLGGAIALAGIALVFTALFLALR